MTVFTPTINDVEIEARGLLITSIGDDGWLIATGPDAGNPQRALEAFVEYTRTIIDGPSIDGSGELHDALVHGDLTVAICPTEFRRPADEDELAWIAVPHTGSQPAAWLVPATHPAAQ